MLDTNFLSQALGQMQAAARGQIQQRQGMTAPQAAPQLDSGDPVTQTLAAMHQDGSLPESAPAHDALPAESQVHGVMRNLMDNSVGAQDSSIGIRALALISDLLDAPHHVVQSLAGTDQAQMDERYKRLAANVPAPSSTQMLQMATAGMGGGPGAAGFLQQMMNGEDTGRRWSPTTVKIAGDVATDPTSYIGVGLGKGLAKAGIKAGVPLAVQKGLNLAAAGDEGAAAALGAIGDMVTKGIQMGVFKAPNRALANMFPELPKWTEYAKNTAAMGDALQWLDHKGLDLNVLQNGLKQGAMTIQDVLGELPMQLGRQIDPTQLFHAINDTKTADRELAYQGYKKFLLKDMGLDNPNMARNFYTQFTDWWKQQALASLSYIYSNAKSGVIGSMLQNGPGGAARTAADLLDNAHNILAGQPFNTQRATDLAGQIGQPIPKSLHEMADNALNATAGPSTARTLLGTTGRDALLGAGVGALGAYEDNQNPLVGALIGGATMAKLPAVASRIRKSSQGVETVLREGAWVEGTSKSLFENMATMENMLVGAMVRGRPGKTLGQRTFDDIENMVRSADGAVDPTVAMNYLRNRGVDPDTVNMASHAMDDLMHIHSQQGVGNSNAFNFDYQDLSPIERVMTQFFPFSTWYLKAIPFYTKQGFQHPVLAHLLTDKAEASSQVQDERGLPTRFAGTLPNQQQGGLLSKLIGRPVEAFSDPLAAILPFGGLARDIQSSQFDDGPDADPVKKILDAMGMAGFSPNPALATAAQVAGVGSDMGEPSNSSLLRWGGPIGGATALASRGVEAATGQNPGWYFNPSRGVEKIIDTVRQAGDAATHGGQGRQVTDPMELATERRVDELALKNTGQPIGSDAPSVAPYLRAKTTKSGPIWQQATQQVQQERGAQSLLGFAAPDLRPDAILTPEEAQIRLAKGGSLVDAQAAHALTQAANTNPNDMADPKIVAQVQAANDAILQITGNEMPQVVKDRLANPTNANVAWVSSQIYAWQTEQAPLMKGYGAGGSPEQRRLGNEIGMMSHAGEDISGPDQAALVQANQASAIAQGVNRGLGPLGQGNGASLRGTGPITAAAKIPQQDSANIKAQDPLLQEYLSWRTTNPGKNLEDFLKEKYGK